VVVDLEEARGDAVRAPRCGPMVDTVPPAIPPLLVLPAGVGGKEHSARLQCRAQLAQHPRQIGARDVKERRVGKNAVEATFGQVEPEEILLPDFAPAERPSHFRKAWRAFQSDRDVALRGERLEIATRPTS